jgi:hypothetical protein
MASLAAFRGGDACLAPSSRHVASRVKASLFSGRVQLSIAIGVEAWQAWVGPVVPPGSPWELVEATRSRRPANRRVPRTNDNLCHDYAC